MVRRSLVGVLLLALAHPAPALADDADLRFVTTSVAPDVSMSFGQRLRLLQNGSDNEVVIAFTGDTLIHAGVSSAARRNGPPYDFRPMFDGVRHILSRADLAICHLEVPLDPDSGTPTGYPIFSAPAEVAEGLAYAGFDGCSTASNHAYDRGEIGVGQTIDVLEAAGLSQVGMATEAASAETAILYEVGDLTIAHLSATYSLNGFRTPADKEWLVQRIDTGVLIDAALRARHDGADLVVVSLHCCAEYRVEPTARQLEVSHKLVGSPLVDLVVTHHSHWVGPVEVVGDEFILHGMGNFLSGQTHTPRTADGVIALVTADRSSGDWRFSDVEIVPTIVQRYTYRVRAVEPGSASFERTVGAIAAMGVEVDLYRLPPMSLLELSLIE